MMRSRVQASSRSVSSSALTTRSRMALPISVTALNGTRAGRRDGGHQRRAAAGGEGQLQVVDLAGQAAVGVDQLAVQQLQGGGQGASGHGGQLPALVRTISGMVATATTTSKRR